MVFSSHLFLYYFLPLALLVYYLLPARARNLGLTALSYLFYGWANPAFMLLMLASTLVDWVAALVMVGRVPWQRRGQLPRLDPSAPRGRRQRLALLASLLTNLGLLGSFKYAGFVGRNLDQLGAVLGLETGGLGPALQLTLPLGISFYTFQSMSYSIDVYRGRVAPLANLVDFACYVSMFPQLVAGPIVRFSEVASELLERSLSLDRLARGSSMFMLGLAKKVLLANPAGRIADTAFALDQLATADAWWGLLAYGFQIYFDFSGYSDMAIGLGLALGFVFPKNFDSPYRSRSITEFWRRWHMSLSRWLRDYLYLPLGGNRLGPRRTYLNLLLVMLLGGLWHGAAWNFVVWGALHGALLALERIAGKRALYAGLPRPLQVLATLLLVHVGWVFFRADTLTQAGSYLQSLCGLSTPGSADGLVAGLIYGRADQALMLAAALVTWVAPQSWDFTRRLSPARVSLCLALFLAALLALASQAHNPFIYFIF